MNDEPGTDGFYESIPELDHFTKLKRCIDVKKREGNFTGEECFLGEAHHAGGIFTDRIEHDRVGEFRRYFADDLYALSFEQVEMVHF